MSLNVVGLQTQQKREPPNGPPFAPASADNGLSVDPVTGHIVLGQDFGAPGNPAGLLSIRQIPINGFTIVLQDAPFPASGQSVLDISTDLTSGLGFCFFFDLQAANASIVGVMGNSGITSAGAVIQYQANNDQGTVGLLGIDAATVPAKIRGSMCLATQSAANPNVVLVSGNLGTTSIWTGIGGVNTELYRFLTPVQANLNFPNTLPFTSSDLTVNVPGAADGDLVNVGVPVGSTQANSLYTWFVSAPGVVTVRFCNISAVAIDPAIGLFSVAVTKILPP